MSGTSMDGVDLVYVNFSKNPSSKWSFTINCAKTFKYPPLLLEALKQSFNFSSNELLQLDKELGRYFSSIINDFIFQNSIDKSNIDCISSHGHTIFHQPSLGYTYQIGCGDTIAFETGIKVVNDFRQKDVIAGGQGAPLVPIGDKLLFENKAEAFLNIGGISNICIPSEKTIAYDICPGNLPLNRVMNSLNLEYDDKGLLSSKGNVDQVILKELAKLKFYTIKPPKSLGTEWLNDSFYPIIDQIDGLKNQLSTIVEHISQVISDTLHQESIKKVMITGGGVKNDFLIHKIQLKYSGEILIPSDEIVEFKEAIIFGFLGALYLAEEINCLSSVTGANKDSIGGVLHIP